MWIGARTWEVAIDGVWSIGATVRDARRCERSAHLIRRTWGPWPLLVITAIAAVAGFGGQYLEHTISGHMFSRSIYWPVMLFSIAYALRVRHLIFRSPTDDEFVIGDAQIVFRALALPLLPGIALLIYFDALMRLILDPLAFPPVQDVAHAIQLLMAGLETFTGLAAATAVIVGSMCYSKNWGGVLLDLFVRYIVFKILIAVAMMVIGLLSLGRIISWVAMAITSVALSPTLIARLDAMGEHGLMALAYTALIGGIWLVAESAFDDLRLEGDVDVLDALEKIMEAQDKDTDDDTEGADGDTSDDDGNTPADDRATITIAVTEIPPSS